MPPVTDKLPGGVLHDVAAVHQHLSLVGGIHSAQDIEDGGFTGAGGADNKGKFSLFDGKINTVAGGSDDLAGTVAFIYLLHFHKCHRSALFLCAAKCLLPFLML